MSVISLGAYGGTYWFQAFGMATAPRRRGERAVVHSRVWSDHGTANPAPASSEIVFAVNQRLSWAPIRRAWAKI